MARPQKEGLGYFPMDTDIDQDDKLIVPIAKHGMLGFGVIVRMMMEIYKNGYYYPWTQREKHVFPFRIGVEPEKVEAIIGDCIESGFFSGDQMIRNNILTSYGFQKRFLLATTRRKDAVIDPIFMVNPDTKELLHTKGELMHAITQEMHAISTQSKVNEIKVNKNKLNEDLNIVFSHWKSKDLVKHRSLNPQIASQITWKLREYSIEELVHAITTYADILSNGEYKLNTRWSLDDFLEKGHFEKFLPDRDPYSFYPKVIKSVSTPRKSKFETDKEDIQQMYKEAEERERNGSRKDDGNHPLKLS